MFGDHAGARALFEQEREKMLAASPAQMALDLEARAPGAGLALLTDEAVSIQLALVPGIEGTWDDCVAQVTPWGFEVAQVSVPVLLLHGRPGQGRTLQARSMAGLAHPRRRSLVLRRRGARPPGKSHRRCARLARRSQLLILSSAIAARFAVAGGPARRARDREACGGSELNRGFDGQPSRGSDVFALGMWHWGPSHRHSALCRTLRGQDGGALRSSPVPACTRIQIPAPNGGFPASTMDGYAGSCRHDVPSCRQNRGAAARGPALFADIRNGLTVSGSCPGRTGEGWMTEPQSLARRLDCELFL
jgi:hypothetical protein